MEKKPVWRPDLHYYALFDGVVVCVFYSPDEVAGAVFQEVPVVAGAGSGAGGHACDDAAHVALHEFGRVEGAFVFRHTTTCLVHAEDAAVVEILDELLPGGVPGFEF